MNYHSFIDTCVSAIDTSMDSAINDREIDAETIHARKPFNLLNGNDFGGHNLFTLSFSNDSDLRYITKGQIDKYNSDKSPDQQITVKSEGHKPHGLMFYKTSLLDQSIEHPIVQTFGVYNVSALELPQSLEQEESKKHKFYRNYKEINQIIDNLDLPGGSTVNDIVYKSSALVNQDIDEPNSVKALRQNIASFEICARYGMDYKPTYSLNQDEKNEVRNYLQSPQHREKLFQDIYRVFEHVTTLNKTNEIVNEAKEDKEQSNLTMADSQDRIYLRVPYHEVIAAKELGASWDNERQQLYLNKGDNLNHFTKWLDEPISLTNTEKVDQYTNTKSPKRIYLNVPKKERENVKKYGARWDHKLMAWFITDESKLPYVRQYHDPNFKPWATNYQNNNTEKQAQAPAQGQTATSQEASEVKTEGKIYKPLDMSKAIYINVPFNDIPEAKALGAWFDYDLKSWFVPEFKDVKDFAKWYDKDFDPKNQPRQIAVYDHTEVMNDFREHLINAGADPSTQIITDTKSPMRIQAVGDKAGSKNIAYQLHTDGKPAGFIKNFKTGFEEKYVFNGQRKYEQISVAELEARRLAMEQKRAANIQQKQNDFARSASYAQEDYAKAIPLNFNDKSTYLAKKGITENILYSLKELDPKFEVRYAPFIGKNNKEFKNLVFPLRDINGQIKSTQTINTIGDKKIGYNTYAPGRGEFASSQKNGCFFAIGDIENAKRVFVAEGIATAMTVAAATKTPTIAAIDCHNMETVVKKLKESGKLNNTEIIIAADNDFANTLEGKKNSGVESALRTVAEHNDVKFVFPSVMDKNITDFNDIYMSRQNLNSVNNMINTQLTNLENKKDMYFGLKEERIPDEHGNFIHKITVMDRAGIHYSSFVTDENDLREFKQNTDNNVPMIITGEKHVSINQNSNAIELSINLQSIKATQQLSIPNSQQQQQNRQVQQQNALNNPIKEPRTIKMPSPRGMTYDR